MVKSTCNLLGQYSLVYIYVTVTDESLKKNTARSQTRFSLGQEYVLEHIMDGDESPLDGGYVSPSRDNSESHDVSYDLSSPESRHAPPSPKDSPDEGSSRDYGRVPSPRSDSLVGSASHVSAPSSPSSLGQDEEFAEDFDAGSPNVPCSPEADEPSEGNEEESEVRPQPSPTSLNGEKPSPSSSPQPEDFSQFSQDDNARTEKSYTDDMPGGSGDGENTVEKPQSDEKDNDEEEEEEHRRSDSSNESEDGDSSERKNLLDSDDSDDDLDEEQRKKKLGNLIVNIFGEDIDEDADASRDNDEEEVQDQHEEQHDEGYQDDYDGGEKTGRGAPGFEWDFDLMLREKKAERKRKRKRRDAGIDIINDDDGLIAHMVNAMKNAAKEDRHSNTERKPALKKRKMLHEVKMMLLRMDMLEAMIDGGMMSAVSEWLAPLPDKSLPALEIRTELLKILSGFGNLDQGVLKQSGLGRAVMLLYKHPRETKENKALAAHIIREWSRPIFQLDTDFRSVSREERVQRDLEHMSSVKKKRLSGELGPSDLPPAPPKPKEREVNRARVPRPSTKDYVVRPKSNVEGEFKGERKAKAFARLDRAHREFLERTRRVKAKRAVGVSLEGRNLAL
ncbi:hypothetical protein KIN20_021625 [Parelaphostrongylus tenuis]|uniref:TFIIS N-terminal domain-containing protein n=1 Tax=Parelaphostrongylus tenuis TaxID=148309 RepID=A0AAD5QUR4_PARTN|nr:hypothetical protein KIN20_021625 [Parelaphostrongylus tenuis]